jgi:hypothetical protein
MKISFEAQKENGRLTGARSSVSFSYWMDQRSILAGGWIKDPSWLVDGSKIQTA